METQAAYQELGLTPSASDAQIKATWRRLVAAWHPDRNAAAEAGGRMQRINKAYQHIRLVRDSSDSSDSSDGAQGGEGGEGGAADAPDSAWTAASAAPSDAPGSIDVRTVRLSLEDAVLGCTRTLRGQVTHTCDACLGQGQQILAQACATCRGSGSVRKAALFGWLWHEEACAECGGDGRQRAVCAPCDGRGERPVAYRRRVRFPAGVRTGHVLSVPASRHGGVDIGLELHVEIESHPLFSLDDDGVLRCEMPVNGYAWMAGRWVDVPTPTGLQQMRLNRDAVVYRLAGQGFPNTPRGARGDYIVKVLPVFAAQDDPASAALLDQLIASSSRAVEADTAQPFGQWQRSLKRWHAKHKEPARDD